MNNIGCLIYKCRLCNCFFHGIDYAKYYGPNVKLVFDRHAYSGNKYMTIKPRNTMHGGDLPPEEIHLCDNGSQGIGDLVGMGPIPDCCHNNSK